MIFLLKICRQFDQILSIRAVSRWVYPSFIDIKLIKQIARFWGKHDRSRCHSWSGKEPEKSNSGEKADNKELFSGLQKNEDGCGIYLQFGFRLWHGRTPLIQWQSRAQWGYRNAARSIEHEYWRRFARRYPVRRDLFLLRGNFFHARGALPANYPPRRSSGSFIDPNLSTLDKIPPWQLTRLLLKFKL